MDELEALELLDALVDPVALAVDPVDGPLVDEVVDEPVVEALVVAPPAPVALVVVPLPDDPSLGS